MVQVDRSTFFPLETSRAWQVGSDKESGGAGAGLPEAPLPCRPPLFSPGEPQEKLEGRVQESDSKDPVVEKTCRCVRNSWEKPFYYPEMDLFREMEFVVDGEKSFIERFGLLGYKDGSMRLYAKFKNEEAYKKIYERLRRQVGMPLPSCIIADIPTHFHHPAGTRAMSAVLEEELSFAPEEKAAWKTALKALPPQPAYEAMVYPLSLSLPYEGFVKSRLLPLTREFPFLRSFRKRGVETFKLITADPQSSVSEVTLCRDNSTAFRILVRMSSEEEYQGLKEYLAGEGIEIDSWDPLNMWQASSEKELLKALEFLESYCEMREKDHGFFQRQIRPKRFYKRALPSRL